VVVKYFSKALPRRHIKDYKKIDINVLGDIGKLFAQVLALNTTYSTYTSGGGGEK
jgi:hypothetical protein